MPRLTHDELQDIVDAGGLCAFSIDTNVFHRYGYNLDTTALLAPAQLPWRGVAYVISEVVAREVLSHVVENQEKVAADLRDALRRYAKARRHLQADVDKAAPGLGLDADVAADARRRWSDYVAATGATLLNASDWVDASELTDMYFDLRPPFEPSEEKKAEFPDAIALLELEGYGEREGRHVLAVSRDGGWAAFAEAAERLVVVDDLPSAIAMFHTADRAVAERAVALLADDASGIRDDLDRALSRFVDDLNPEVDGSSFMEFSAEFSGAELRGIDPVDPTGVVVLASDADVVTLAFEVGVSVRVEADFAFYVHDSVDDDYMGMGTTSAERDVSIVVPVTMRVVRGVTEEDGAVEVRVERLRPLSVHFGNIEPSGWRGE